MVCTKGFPKVPATVQHRSAVVLNVGLDFIEADGLDGLCEQPNRIRPTSDAHSVYVRMGININSFNPYGVGVGATHRGRPHLFSNSTKIAAESCVCTAGSGKDDTRCKQAAISS